MNSTYLQDAVKSSRPKMNKADLKDQRESIREVSWIEYPDRREDEAASSVSSIGAALLVGFVGKIAAARRLVSNNRIHAAILDRLYESTPIYRSAR